ncbi:M23 family metallopeptidase [Halobacillus campisalis]|uniref:M23 family metallopeptidase n=1 Tax=Halobacillus campisalis TaxID=435909 RepID=A0ABW2K8T4_9BACI|nr:M23 family metallopeptidase [Halobacillus campisalis]
MHLMMWFQAFIYLLLPLFLLYRVVKNDYTSQRLWFIEWLSTAAFIGFLFVVGPWHIFFYYFRYIWLLIFIVVSIVSFKKIKMIPRKGPKHDKSYKFSIGISAVLAVYFGFIMIVGLSGYVQKSGGEIALDFPLKDGVFAVGHGGSTTKFNYHASHPNQRYSYDILQLNGWGLRAEVITPSELEQYEIYGAQLYSPCAGNVISAVDKYEDIPPLQSDIEPEEPAGNHVILSCENTGIHIAHFKPRTVEVQEGQDVDTGDVLGEVGNTGNTTEPHLHIHAERDGEGVPITFNERFLKRNSLVFN